MVERMGGEQFVPNNSERPKLACDLFIFNKVNSRLSLESHFLPNIPGCSPERCDYQDLCRSPLAAGISLENMG